MKLAESLILRADCQKRFEQLKERAPSRAQWYRKETCPPRTWRS